MNVFIQAGQPFSAIIRYVLTLIGNNRRHQFFFTSYAEQALVKISSDASDLPLSQTFYERVEAGKWDVADLLDENGLITATDGKSDLLATIFYWSNCLQEYGAPGTCFDHYGRFAYRASWQYRHGTSQRNIVQECIDALCTTVLNKVPAHDERTRVFLSHDIDAIYGSLVHDTWWALRSFRFAKMLHCLVQNTLRGPQWFCIDRIMNIHSERDLTSTFFWMTERGRDSVGIRNADYRISDPRVVATVQKSADRGFGQGLHKSTLGSSMREERHRLPVPATNNRYHYLKFQLPQAWEEMEQSGMRMDASLGFAGHIGFRNHYGSPFCPYNFNTKQGYHFVEVPLHVMDITFEKYMHCSLEEGIDQTIAFFEKHQYNCVISVLWHNMSFTEFQFEKYLNSYKRLLGYFYEAGVRSIHPDEIQDRYNWNAPAADQQETSASSQDV
ncbi:MAG: hypothetical protein R3301_04855 [Saprospiraceae bacterium]|nr:hypothetical protein [Saprospiraceae bacterium]